MNPRSLLMVACCLSAAGLASNVHADGDGPEAGGSPGEQPFPGHSPHSEPQIPPTIILKGGGVPLSSPDPNEVEPTSHGAPITGEATINPGVDTTMLSYGFGGVMTSPIKVYLLWYGTWGGSTTPTIVQNFVANLGGSPYFKIAGSYYDSSYINIHVPNSVTLSGVAVENDYAYGFQLTQGSMTAIVDNAANKLWGYQSDAVYFVLTSSDVNFMDFAGRQFCAPSLCGEHSYTTDSPPLKWAWVGGSANCPACQWPFLGPSGNNEADRMVSWIAHELEETVTDPIATSGWADTSNPPNENGDLCQGTLIPAGTYGSTMYTASNGGSANVHLGGADYLIQENWVNTDLGGCDYRMSRGVPTAPSARSASDFNGDHRSDVLWRHAATGEVETWLMKTNGYSYDYGPSFGNVSSNWEIYGTGDFDGDSPNHRADILWKRVDTSMTYPPIPHPVDPGGLGQLVWLIGGSGVNITVTNNNYDPNWLPDRALIGVASNIYLNDLPGRNALATARTRKHAAGVAGQLL